jgi:UDPglucose 6-dehydrogenase
MQPRVGFIGLGKLGLPVALAINSYGFDVCGTDINNDVATHLICRKIPYKEELADDLLKTHTIQWCHDVDNVIRNSDVIFMPVQTPHNERYEGITRLPPERKDFDYSYLVQAVKNFANALHLSSDPSPKTLVIISTVLPGTIRREIMPLIKDDKRIILIYNPFFIAMGTTIHDFLDPEFVLLGMNDTSQIPGHLLYIYNELYMGKTRNFIAKGGNNFYQVMSIESAELTKVAYNTFITSKICIVNTLMEICHKIPGANIDDVTKALKNANKRIVSTMYMNGGMGDGGGCHPRDNIAMSWLAKKIDLSYDWFENLMLSREKQAEFFAQLIIDNYVFGDKVYILGYEFKPETNLTTGSHALLVYNLLKDSPLADDLTLLQSSGSEDYIFEWPDNRKRIFFIGCKQQKFAKYKFRSGSVVIDPFRYIPDQPGVRVIRVGE